MSTKIELMDLSGVDLALWAARALGIEKDGGISLFASNGCLYRDLGNGLVPFPFRPDSSMDDCAAMISQMTAAGTLTLFNHGAQFEASGFGHVGHSGNVTTALTRCYIAWKLGSNFVVADQR